MRPSNNHVAVHKSYSFILIFKSYFPCLSINIIWRAWENWTEGENGLFVKKKKKPNNIKVAFQPILIKKKTRIVLFHEGGEAANWFYAEGAISV